MRRFAVIAAVAMLVTPALAQGQTRIAVARGVGEYDLSGVDDGTVTALRLSQDLARFFTLEAGLSYVKLVQDFGVTKLYQPEVQAQVRLPIGRFSPHVGVGTGVAVNAPEDSRFETEVEMTLNAGAGFRLDLPYRLGLVGDGRLRNIGKPFTATGADATFGISYSF